MQRLDKLISAKLNISRSQAKTLIKTGSVTINGTAVLSCDEKCGDTDEVRVDGRLISNDEFVYIMLNKPKDVICASDGKGEKTVVDLVPDDLRVKGLFPAGRLDKDTTGFALITNDGEFAHNILSPKHHIEKTYIATLDKPITDAVIADFEGGMTLGEEKLKSAKLTPLNPDKTEAEVVISQGIYHQIKRMFKKHGLTVLELRRTAIGNLKIDEKLAPGECRAIKNDELQKIRDNSPAT